MAIPNNPLKEVTTTPSEILITNIITEIVQRPQNPHFFHLKMAMEQTISHISAITNDGIAHHGESGEDCG
jgi:hypothetical protein